MSTADAGTNYGASDDKLAAVFDEKFKKLPEIETAHVPTNCTQGCWSTDCF
jgi:hypothetical protein